MLDDISNVNHGVKGERGSLGIICTKDRENGEAISAILEFAEKFNLPKGDYIYLSDCFEYLSKKKGR